MKTFQTTAIADEHGRVHLEVEGVKPGETVELLVVIGPAPEPNRGQPPSARRFGTMQGQIQVADDFDAPLPADIQRYFDGEGED